MPIKVKEQITFGIDASMLVYTGSGVASYTFNLVKGLLKYASQHEYRIFYSSRRVPADTQKMLDELKQLGAKICKYPFPPWFLKIIWNRFHIIPVEWFIGKVEYYHSSDFLRPPLLNGTKGITTLHDLTWKKFPELHTPEIIEGHTHKLQKTIEGGDMIICDSQNTKKDLLKYYPTIEQTNKIMVIYPGIDERFRPMNKDECEQILQKYSITIETDYLLYVGAIEPRKNLPLTIEVFNEFIKDKKYAHFKLILVGRAGWKNEEVFNKIKDLRLHEKVRFIGYVENDDLPAVYNGAKCLMYLSSYEGFGLPPLEALQCKKPIVALRNSSLEELLSSYFLANEESVQGILEKLEELLNSRAELPVTNAYRWDVYIENFFSSLLSD